MLTRLRHNAMTREETIKSLTNWAESIFAFIDSTRKQFEELKRDEEIDTVKLDQLSDDLDDLLQSIISMELPSNIELGLTKDIMALIDEIGDVMIMSAND
jgi:hypothetical protein